MSYYDAAKRAAMVQSTLMIIGFIDEITIVECMHCGDEFLVEPGSDQFYMPNYGHDCVPVPIHPRLALNGER